MSQHCVTRCLLASVLILGCLPPGEGHFLGVATAVAAPQPPQPAKPNAPPAKPEAQHPFPRRFPIPEFPADATWLNTRPLRIKNLKGKFVLLDFWTYCCINCIHILPELKKLERQYPSQLVVIGVHSAKFETEKDDKNIAEAILRYEIEHPVVNDADHKIWNSLGVRSWPSLLLIDPEGNAVWGTQGEIQAADVAEVLDRALPYYRANKLLDESPVRFELLSYQAKSTPLRFPGKVLADEAGGRLFISDSNHNRIVVSDLSGKLLEIIGSGKIGRRDGGYATASFDHLQGLALSGNTLYVADTENHLLRKVDLQSKQVTTIAGTGEQGRLPWPGLEKLKTVEDLPQRWVGKPLETAVNSPWALWVHQQQLYIAMAGPHQIWRMPLNESEIGPYAGSSREDIVDGRLLPAVPPQLPGNSEGSAFAQPSGLTSDGKWLYVADSEGSSIRAVPFDESANVRTVVGTASLPHARLFTFGDRDGPRSRVLLQHALGVCFHEGQLLVADTYNNKIKTIDAQTGAAKTLAGTGKPGTGDDPAEFDEPAGLSYANGTVFIADTNNHLIRTLDLKSGKVGKLEIKGLQPPQQPPPKKPNFDDAAKVSLPPIKAKLNDGKLKFQIQLTLPLGWKLNDLAPWACWVEAAGPQGVLKREALGKVSLTQQQRIQLDFALPAESQGKDTVTISLPYYYCSEGGLCKVGSVVWKVEISIDPQQGKAQVPLPYTVPSGL